MLAAQLLRFHIDFVIIDTKSAPTKESRAVVVQARSLEIYEQLGLANDILANGNTTSGLCFWRKGKRLSEVKLSDFGSDITPFNFVFMYEQSKNEALLYKYLQDHGKEVMWNTELLFYEEKNNGYEIKLKTEEKEITIATQYLVACDGARSKLRELANVAFEGGTYQQVFYVADTHVAANVCADKLNFFVTKNTFHLLFPLEGEERFRAIGILPQQFYHQNKISFEEVSQQVENDAGMSLDFYNTQWYSTYRLHHKKVSTFNKGNLFFCGDAAHVHSPAGGQGMNTGLQDAYNLAWKLALVVSKKAKPLLLSTYHEERNPVAEHLLSSTDAMFNMMSKDSALSKLLRLYIFPFILPVLMKLRRVRRKFFLTVSQTEISYSSSVSLGKARKIKAGMRLPYLILSIDNEQQSVYRWLSVKNEAPFLVLFYNLSEENLDANKGLSPVTIESNAFNQNVLTKAGFPSSFILLLRPDNYIGYIAEQYEKEKFNNYLNQNLQLIK